MELISQSVHLLVSKSVSFFYMVKGPAADATDAPQPYGFLCNTVMKMGSFFTKFYKYWSTSGMKLTGENRQLGEKPVPVPLCAPQTPHGLVGIELGHPQ
jgi:hypothetical protein